MGTSGKYFGKGGSRQDNNGEVLCGSGEIGVYIFVRDVGNEHLVVEIPQGFPPPGGAVDGGHGTQTSTGWDMGVCAHWSGAGNVGARGGRSIYFPPTEHVRTIHCDFSYHGLVSGGGAESGTAPIQEMVGSACPRYPGDNGC